MLMIETLILALSVLIISILEFRAFKNKKPISAEEYEKVKVNSSIMNEEVLIRRIEETVKKGLGGLGMNDFIDKLKNEKGIKGNELVGMRNKGRSSSFRALNRDLEDDERRVNTDPIEGKTKKKYDNRTNPFLKSNDPDHPNNCIAVCSRGPKNEVPEERRITKVIQTGNDA